MCIEDLSVKNIEKNHRLAQAINDCGWSMFVGFLEYKCDRVNKVDKFFARVVKLVVFVDIRTKKVKFYKRVGIEINSVFCDNYKRL